MTKTTPTSVESPDQYAEGFLGEAPDPFRYDRQPNDPDEVIGLISRAVPTGARVLDVGCGTGSVSSQLAANRNATIVGLEPDAARAQRARERGIEVRTALLTSETVRDLGLFDVVLFADVLEHLADPLALLRIAKTALVPNGRIVASVPNVAHWSVRFDLLRGRFAYRDCGIMDATHLRWFTKDGLELLIGAAGCQVQSMEATAGYDLECYLTREPWRRVRDDIRRPFIKAGVRRWPRLFGCQWVVSATPI